MVSNISESKNATKATADRVFKYCEKEKRKGKNEGTVTTRMSAYLFSLVPRKQVQLLLPLGLLVVRVLEQVRVQVLEQFPGQARDQARELLEALELARDLLELLGLEEVQESWAFQVSATCAWLCSNQAQ